MRVGIIFWKYVSDPIFHHSKPSHGEFPGDPVVRTPCCHCKGPEFKPWLGNKDSISHTTWQNKTKTLPWSRLLTMTPVLCQAPHTAPLTSASLELCNDLAILPSCISPNSKLCHLWVFTHGYWRRQWQPTPVLLPGKSHGQRSLVGCSPWGCKESDTTERPHFHFSLSCTGEGNGNPLQYSCLENPRDGGAWCAAVCGVTQSRTRLKQLSSSSIIPFA